jgi:hypothetical protein
MGIIHYNGFCKGQTPVVIIIIIIVIIIIICNHSWLKFHNYLCNESGAEFWTPTAILQSRLVPQIVTYSYCYLYFTVLYFCKAIFTDSVLAEIKYQDSHPRHVHNYGPTNNIYLKCTGTIMSYVFLKFRVSGCSGSLVSSMKLEVIENISHTGPPFCLKS